MNEIEAHLRKAARGAGLSWGLAEEAGKAARWLEAHGIRSAQFFAVHFESIRGRAYRDIAMMGTEGRWRARQGALCPIIAGAALVDRAEEIADGSTIDMDAIAFPVLLAPFAATVSLTTGAGILLEWPGVRFTFERDCVRLKAANEALSDASAPKVSCRRAKGPAQGTPQSKEMGGVPVDDSVWSRLEILVQCTYVPASDESRLKGAGAGLLDTD